MYEPCSGTLSAIKEDQASVLLFVLNCLKATSQRVEMDEDDGQSAFEPLDEQLDFGSG